MGYLLVTASLLLFGFLSLLLLPFLVSLSKTALHRCAKCLNEVKSNSYFGFASMEDKLVSLQLGKFGIILTRKQLMYFALVLSMMIGIYMFVLVEERHNHEAVPISDHTWPEYRQKCGFDAYAKNPREAMMNFDRYYFNKGVSWRGYVVRVNLNDEDPMSMVYHSASLLIKMEEDDREGVHGADLGLSLSDRVLTMYSDEIDSLRRGDYLEFNATL